MLGAGWLLPLGWEAAPPWVPCNPWERLLCLLSVLVLQGTTAAKETGQGRMPRETGGPHEPQAMSSFSPPRGVLIELVNPEPNQLSEPHQLVVS